MGKAFASPRRLELLDLLAQAPRTRRGARARERAVDRQRLPAPAGAARGRDGHPHTRRHERALRARRRGGAAPLAGPARRLGGAAGGGRARRARLPRRGRRDDRPRGAVANGWRAATSCSSTCGRRRSSPPATSRARARSRSPSSSAGWPSCHADREVVAYCRGPFCAYAHEAVRRLDDAGRTASRLEEGEENYKSRANDQRLAKRDVQGWRHPYQTEDNTGPAKERSPGGILRVAVGPQRQ